MSARWARRRLATGLFAAGGGPKVRCPGSSATLTITVRVGAAGAIVNTAGVVASDQRDPDSTNDEATAGISASGATPPPTVTNASGSVEPGALAPWLLGMAFAVLALMASAVLASRNRAFRRRL